MDWNRMGDALYDGKVDEVAALTKQALDKGHTAQEVLNQGLLMGIDKVGKDFKADLLFLPEVLRSGKAMHAGMDVLKPLLSESEGTALGTFVIGTVKGDLHDIGKNLVGMMLSGVGMEVVDLGIDAPADKFAEAIKEHHPQIVGMSALLTTTMDEMETTIQALKDAGLRDKVKIMVGGAPVTQDFAEKIGADGYAYDAVSAVDLARVWLQS
ncbi:MAG: cobalamin-binding protein [Chloroflexi bacterium B3_Chlor]|nr:MAG: cobalamin-binding protein [Chloroflexi bacterium B3_Chlor]